MNTRWLWPLIAPLITLTACGTPQQQCIGAATRDMRVVDRLITETQGNLARGYGFETTTVFVSRWQNCTPAATEANPTPAPKLCFEDVPQIVQKAVALDLAAEAAKLASLRQKRDQQMRASAGAVAACKAEFPE